ncbi:MAG: HAD family hydrolase [Actinomycetota bacterium]
MGDERPLVVFDGDDTLWFVEHLYDRARSAAADLVARFGLDPVAWEQLQRAIDVRNVEVMGLQATRFPTSCARAYIDAACSAGVQPTAARAAEVWACASQVFDWDAQPADGVRDVLEELSRSFRLALLTKGDGWVQRRRVADSGLGGYFCAVEIVDDKSSETFRAVVAGCGAELALSWSVGNSLASDINPALECGMRAVWVDAHVWEHERRETTAPAGRAFLRAEALRDVPGLLLD